LIEVFPLNQETTILTETVRGFATVSLGFFFPFGSIHESPEEKGYTHFCEHLILKSTDQRGKLIAQMEGIGVELGGYTEREHMVLTLSCHKTVFPQALPLFLDLLAMDEFSTQDVEVEKAIILSEIMQTKDDPEDRVFELMWEKSFPQDHPILGTSQSVQGVTPEKLSTFYRRRLRQKPLISIVGDINPNTCCQAIANGLWAEEGNPRDTQPRIRPLPPKLRYYEAYQSEAMYLLLNQWLNPWTSPEESASQGVFHHLLGDNLTSPLFHRFREEEGLCYQIGSFALDHGFVSSFSIMAVLPQDNLDRFFQLWEDFIPEIPLIFDDAQWAKGIENYQLLQEMAGDSMEYRMKNNAEYYLSFKVFPQAYTRMGLRPPPKPGRDFSVFALGPVQPWA
jgi:predicted Zn-dependent peptidase